MSHQGEEDTEEIEDDIVRLLLVEPRDRFSRIKLELVEFAQDLLIRRILLVDFATRTEDRSTPCHDEKGGCVASKYLINLQVKVFDAGPQQLEVCLAIYWSTIFCRVSGNVVEKAVDLCTASAALTIGWTTRVNIPLVFRMCRQS